MQSICIIYCTSNWYIFSCSSLICHGFTKLPSYNVSMLVLSQLGFSSQKYMVIFNLRDPSHEHILLFFFLSPLTLSLSLSLLPLSSLHFAIKMNYLLFLGKWYQTYFISYAEIQQLESTHARIYTSMIRIIEVLRIKIMLLLGSISNNNVFPLDAFYE